MGNWTKIALACISMAALAIVVFAFSSIQTVEAQSTEYDESLWVRFESNQPGSQVKGTATKQDERLYIVSHSGFPTLPGAEELYKASDSIIYGEIANLSDETVYYIVMKGNVYRDGKLYEKTGSTWGLFSTRLTEKAGYTIELAENPLKISLRPGEVTQFFLWPGQTAWDCYEVWVDSYDLEDDKIGVTPELIKDNIIFEKGEDDSGTFRGKIRNISDEEILAAAVYVIKYDSNNNIFAILGDFVGQLSAGKAKSVTIPTYLPGFQVKTASDNFFYGSPDHIEVIAEGTNGGGFYLSTGREYLLAFESVSQYYPNSKLPKHIDLEEIRKQANAVPSGVFDKNFCQGGDGLIIPSESSLTPSDKIIKRQTKIPNWIRNNAEWWASGAIPDKDFASGIQYLIKEKIMLIPETMISTGVEDDSNKSVTENGYLQVPGTEFFVSRGELMNVKVSGHLDYDYTLPFTLRLANPNSFFNDFNAYVEKNGDFTLNIPFHDKAELGEYQLEVKRGKDLGTVTFQLKAGKPSETVSEQKIPDWIKNNADWWSQGLISDDDFVKGIQYLIEQGIIKV